MPRFAYLLAPLLTAVFLTLLSLNSLAAPFQPADQPTSRLIVTLAGEPLGKSPNRAEQQTLMAEQERFLTAVQQAIPHAEQAYYVNEHGDYTPLRYDTLLNGIVLRVPQTSVTEATQFLRQLPQVTAVYPDQIISPTIFAATPYVNATHLWQHPAIGDAANAGAGVKFATMDWGTHPAAPMFDGTGYSYPPGYPLGDTSHTNGKIIVARAYFRADDPPVAGDAETWPGAAGGSHGVHTGSTAVGNPVTTSLGIELSGIAPAAYVLSYKVFYQSQSGQIGFNIAEGLAALEDIVNDGTDVVNHSWGSFATSLGGAYDLLDTALRNASTAGVVVVMSAGNDGQPTSVHHPSTDYLVVGASHNNYGRLTLITPTLGAMPFAVHAFGPQLTLNQVYSYPLRADTVISPSNVGGCLPWPTAAFSGTAALISTVNNNQASCRYANKVVHAQAAGAEMVVFYHHSSEPLANFYCNSLTACDPDGLHPTIPAVRVPLAEGQLLLDAAVTFSTTAVVSLTYSHTPNDFVAWFSSRGPGLNGELRPDLIAPGVNIYAQGYQFDAIGTEAYHLGYGMARGTSMSAPQVAGGATLLRQIHPDWSVPDIHSALMSTAKFRHVYNEDGSPAQPLDMGAGRLDLRRAADPGLLFSPPRLSVGQVVTGELAVLTVTVRSVADAPQTYTLSFEDTRVGFPGLPFLAGYSVEPSSLMLGEMGEVGDTAVFTVTFDPSQTDFGDQQGYLLLTSDSGHYEAHLPAWARVMHSTFTADVLLIDDDGSARFGRPDYVNIYTKTLTNLGYSYTLLDADALRADGATETLNEVDLAAHRAVLYFSGNNNALDSLHIADRYRLNEYAAQGGTLLVTGQNVRRTWRGWSGASWLGGGVIDFAYRHTLGAAFKRESLTNNALLPTLIITPSGRLPFTRTVSLGTVGDGAGNQSSVDVLHPQERLEAGTLWRGAIITDGVGSLHRQQPTLERTGMTYHGRVVYFSFGLEGVNNDDPAHASREELLGQVLAWGWETPLVMLETTAVSPTSHTFTLTAHLTASQPATSYRWDVGDGTPILTTTSPIITHTYPAAPPASYVARVEVVNRWGNTAASEQTITFLAPTPTPTLIPTITPSPTLTPTITPSPTLTPTLTATPMPPAPFYRFFFPTVMRGN